MDFLLQSLRPWNNSSVERQRSGAAFGLPLERSYSGISNFGGGSGMLWSNQLGEGSDPMLDISLDSGPMPYQRVPSLEGIHRLNSLESIYRIPSMDCLRRASMECFPNDNWQVKRTMSSPQIDDADTIDSSLLAEIDENEESSTAPVAGSAATHIKARRRVRSDSSVSHGSYGELDETRPWEEESVEELNTVPSGFTLPRQDYSLSLGDLRVLARFHVQKAANARGIKLAAGMTNADLVQLADQLGLYPLVFRMHLEASGKVPVPPLHALYLEYKKEAKSRAKAAKACKDLGLASRTRITDQGKVTIDYYEGISLRLGRERDTIFRPLLHRVFREFKADIKVELARAGLNSNEMRKWRESQLCTALFVANKFVEGIWQTAIDVHLSKTKEYI